MPKPFKCPKHGCGAKMKIIFQGNDDGGTQKPDSKKGNFIRVTRPDYHRNPYRLVLQCSSKKCKLGVNATGPNRAWVFSAVRHRIDDAKKKNLVFVPETQVTTPTKELASQ